MPHSTLPATGFQAIILCGPGASFDTFTSHPGDPPKALLPIANRPMVWYALDWLYRSGIVNITLVTPPESAAAIESALARDPHLTSLPAPRPEVLAPAELTLVTGTAAIFRLPEVARAITTDFVVLPCDLICELNGTALLQTWMTLEDGLGGEGAGRRGGLGVWYPVKPAEGSGVVVAVKSAEQADLIGTVALADARPRPPEGTLRQDVSKLVLSIPTTTVKDIVEEEGHLPLRHSLLKTHGNVRLRKTHRDAHVYFFPRWALDMMQANDFDSVAEDVVGWWAKAEWQVGLGDKLGLRDILSRQQRPDTTDDLPPITPGEDLGASGFLPVASIEDEISLLGLSSTSVRRPAPSTDGTNPASSRVPASVALALSRPQALTIPPLLSYVQPSSPNLPLIRRADSTPLLLAISLHLAKLPPSSSAAGPPHPFSHPFKTTHPDMLARQSRVSEIDSLLAANVTVGARAVVKESVVGPGCKIGANARLTRCLLMDGAEVGDGVTLTGCVLGRRCRIEGPRGGGGGGGGATTTSVPITGAAIASSAAPTKKTAQDDDEATKLVDCEVAAGFVVEIGTEAKGEKFVAFEGLDQDGVPNSDSYERDSDSDGDDAGLSEG